VLNFTSGVFRSSCGFYVFGIRGFIRSYSLFTTLTKKDVQSQCCDEDHSPRSFFYFQTLKTFEKIHDIVTLDKGCKSDLIFWSQLCDYWNGISFLYEENIEIIPIQRDMCWIEFSGA